MSDNGKLIGFTGKQLRVNLNRMDVRIEAVSAELTRKYLGGAGYGAKILYDELKPGVDPLSPENILVFATGPLSMSQFPGGGSMMACFKSPIDQHLGRITHRRRHSARSEKSRLRSHHHRGQSS